MNEMDVAAIRRKFVRQIDGLPSAEARALLGELMVFAHLDGETTIEEFEGWLDLMRKLFADCTGPKPSVM
jgi:hypothetical protein